MSTQSHDPVQEDWPPVEPRHQNAADIAREQSLAPPPPNETAVGRWFREHGDTVRLPLWSDINHDPRTVLQNYTDDLKPYFVGLKSLGVKDWPEAVFSVAAFYKLRLESEREPTFTRTLLRTVARTVFETGKPGLQFVTASDIAPEAIDYIWQNRLARGMHTAIAGPGGKGKSQLAYAIIAAITTGGPWPDGKGNAPKGRCIILSAEEGNKDMIVPRLIAAGADLTMVKIVTCVRDEGGERKFNLQRDLDELKKACVVLGDVVLISIDPVSSYMGGAIDTHRNSAVRTVLDPITKAADDIGCAILSITHFNKNTSAKAINRVMESAAFTNAPRAAFCVIEDPDEPKESRLFLSLKTNMGKPPIGIRFHIDEVKAGYDKKRGKQIYAPKVTWDDTVDITADAATEALNEKTVAPKHKQAVDFLCAQLANGPQPAAKVNAEAAKVGISKMTLRRARESLSVASYQPEGKGAAPGFVYALPPTDEQVTPE